MSATSKVRLTCGRVSASLIIVFMIGCSGTGGGGASSTAPTIQPPKIDQFLASPADIAPGDSLKLTYSVTGADSTVLAPPHQVLSTSAAGSVYVKPSHPVRYVLLAYNKVGRDSTSIVIPMASSVPSFSTASLDVDTIVQKDSAHLTYHVVRADSVVLTGFPKLSSADSGRIVLSPLFDKNYSLTAYNSVGTDTAKFSITVETPFAVTPLNGTCYKGTSSSSVLTPALKFKCTDENANLLRKPWIIFEKVDGLGPMSADSLRPDSSGTVSLTYTFQGTYGRAVILAFVRNAQTAYSYVKLRTDEMATGSLGQIQYGMIGDSAVTIRNFDGRPAVFVDQRGYLVYYAYAAQGVVFYINDQNNDGIAEDNEQVEGGAILSPYKGKTLEGIGVGSTYSQVKAAYGPPTSFGLELSDSLYLAFYKQVGIYVILAFSDTTVQEIQFFDPALALAPESRRPNAVAASHEADRPFHSVYFTPN